MFRRIMYAKEGVICVETKPLKLCVILQIIKKPNPIFKYFIIHPKYSLL